MPVNSGARPEAPLGRHTTKFPPVPDPVERLPPVVAAPRAEAPEARVPLPPPPAPETPPVAPPAEVELAVEVDVALLEAAVVLVVVVVVLPAAAGVPVVVAGFEIVGSTTAPPVVGKPLRVEALPTAPFVEVAVCAAAGTVRASSMTMPKPSARVIPRQREAS